MSSTSPLTGKLAQIFSPRLCIFVSTVILAIGVLVTSWAAAFPAFIVGRIITGIGAAGIFTVSIIIVLELSSLKRRGIMIGLLNSGYTIGVALGATTAGALLSRVGWRALFWMQAPISLLGGLVLLFAIPHDFTAGKKKDVRDSVLTRLATLDYLGAITLVSRLWRVSHAHQLTLIADCRHSIGPLLLVCTKEHSHLTIDPLGRRLDDLCRQRSVSC